jgi:hypothetical protein
MMNIETTTATEPVIDLGSDELEELTAPFARVPSIVERLETYGILPPHHANLPERVLEQVEELFVAWYGASDDDVRRAILKGMFPTEADVRRVLLAVVPIYFDTLFFDECVPTRDLVSLVLVGHAKWRRWLSGAA